MGIEEAIADKGFPSEDFLLTKIMHTFSVWGIGKTKKDVGIWLSNFTGEVFSEQYEKLLALWMLVNFTFYNEKEVRHLCRVLYKELLHIVIKNRQPNDNIEENARKFFDKSRIVAVDRTSGSQGFIAYLFRHENSLPYKTFARTVDDLTKFDNIIIIDDVILTSGEEGQMDEYLTNVKKEHPSKKLFLLVLIASKHAREYIQKKFDVEIVTAIQLDSRHKCFDSESEIFASFESLLEHARTMVEHYGKKIGMTNPLGYEGGEYTFGFYYNTPDNTLPIFWGYQNGWNPIMKRYHKNINLEQYLTYGRFV